MFRMTRDWPALADAVKAVRQRLKLTQAQLATAADTSVSTIQKLESGKEHWSDLPDSLPRIERALGWAPGAAAAVLEGADAPPLPERPARPAPPRMASEPADSLLPEGMPRRVKRELTGRAIVEATVVEGSGDSRFVVVWTAGADVDPEEITPEALEQWTRLNRAAHGLPVEPKPDS